LRCRPKPRTARAWRPALLCAAVLPLFACGSSTPALSSDDASLDALPPADDASPDASLDAPDDTMAASPADDSPGSAPDSSPGSHADAGADAIADVGAGAVADGPAESDTDTGSSDDASPDAGPPGPLLDGGPDSPGYPCLAFNLDAGCTPTEQILADKSVDCYHCLVNAGCLNDNVLNDKNNECGDLTGTADAGAEAGAANSDLCLATLRCILRTSCASTDVSICYCGGLGSANLCATATSGADGGCLQAEVNGLYLRATDPPSVVMTDYFNLNHPSGKANQIFTCAKSAACDPFCSH
jgi:hypothetical protein